MSPRHDNDSFTLKFTSLPEVSVWKMMEHVLTDLTGITQHPVSWLKLGRSILGCCAGWSWRKHCFQLADLVTKSRSFLWSIWEDTELIYCYSDLCSGLSSNTENPKRYLDPPFWCDMISRCLVTLLSMTLFDEVFVNRRLRFHIFGTGSEYYFCLLGWFYLKSVTWENVSRHQCVISSVLSYLLT